MRHTYCLSDLSDMQRVPKVSSRKDSESYLRLLIASHDYLVALMTQNIL